MSSYTVEKRLCRDGLLSDKGRALMRMFGVSIDRLRRPRVLGAEFEAKQGQVVFITGPSGAGKSVLLGEIERGTDQADRINLDDIELPDDRAVIDCIDADLLSGLTLLSIAGLSDVFCLLNKPANLSDGEKFRFRLALAMASRKKYVFADEFASALDRVTAAVVAHQVRKFATRNDVTFFLAGAHDDVLWELQPDVIVELELGGGTQVIYREL